MSELRVTFRKDRPVSCPCGTKFIPEDGPVLGVDDRFDLPEVWPVILCPGCKRPIACSSAHIKTMEICA